MISLANIFFKYCFQIFTYGYFSEPFISENNSFEQPESIENDILNANYAIDYNKCTTLDLIKLSYETQKHNLNMLLSSFIIRLGIYFLNESNSEDLCYLIKRHTIERDDFGIQNDQNFFICCEPSILPLLKVIAKQSKTRVVIDMLGTKSGLFFACNDKLRHKLLDLEIATIHMGSIEVSVSNLLKQRKNNELIYTHQNNFDIEEVKNYIWQPMEIFDSENQKSYLDCQKNKKVDMIIQNIKIPVEIKAIVENGDFLYMLETRIKILNVTNRNTLSILKNKTKNKFILDIINKISIVEFSNFDRFDMQYSVLKESLKGFKDLFSANYLEDMVILDISEVRVLKSEIDKFLASDNILNFYEYFFFKYLHFVPDFSILDEISNFLNKNGIILPDQLYDCLVPQMIKNPVLLSEIDKIVIDNESYINILKNTSFPSHLKSPFTRKIININDKCKDKMKLFVNRKNETLRRLGKFRKWFENLEEIKSGITFL